MNDFFELEKKCKKLQKKRVIKYSIFSILSLAVFAGIFLFLLQAKPTTKKETKPKVITKIITKPKIIIKEKNITKVVVKKVYVEKNTTPQKAPVLDLDINMTNIAGEIDSKEKIKTSTTTKTTKKENNSKSILQNETITFSKALTLATNYYENGDYQNSIKWCKLASKIDNNDERIWKLYALNLEKIGQKQKAIKVLKTYLKYKNSLELKYLLQRLEE